MQSKLIKSALTSLVVISAFALLNGCKMFDDSTPQVSTPVPVKMPAETKLSAPAKKSTETVSTQDTSGSTSAQDQAISSDDTQGNGRKMKIIKYNKKPATISPETTTSTSTTTTTQQ